MICLEGVLYGCLQAFGSSLWWRASRSEGEERTAEQIQECMGMPSVSAKNWTGSTCSWTLVPELQWTGALEATRHEQDKMIAAKRFIQKWEIDADRRVTFVVARMQHSSLSLLLQMIWSRFVSVFGTNIFCNRPRLIWLPTMSFAPAAAGGGRRDTGTVVNNGAAASTSESCCFCSKPAALSVSSSLLSRPYCLTHYYTTRAVRSGTTNPDRVHILGPDGSEIFGIEDTGSNDGGRREGTEGQSEMARQLPAMQELFAEAYTSLRDRIAAKLSGTAISSAAAGSQKPGTKRNQNSSGKVDGTKRNAHDPLADLLAGPSPSFSGGSSGKKRGRKRPPPSERPARPKPTTASNPNEVSEGGFVRSVPLPGRYVAQQRKMAAAEVEERRRLMSAGKAPPSSSTSGAASALTHVETNPYKRRKPNRSSIWNLAMEGDAGGDRGASASNTGGGGGTDAASAKSSWDAIERSMRPTVRCTCGSTDVSNDLNITGRGNDMPKG